MAVGISLKWTYVEGEGGGTCKMNRDEEGDKIRGFEWTYYLNDPKVFSL